jgi:5-carboxymethyl-2-hydroxymuconate isomerase
MMMPHVTVEYAGNLESHISARALLASIHGAVLDCGFFKPGAVRTRAARRELYLIADGDPDNSFVHVEVRMGEGRSPQERKQVAETIMQVLREHTRDVFDTFGLGLSVEICEIDEATVVRANNLHTRLTTKG